MKSNYLETTIKLKTGFFKQEVYLLKLSETKLILKKILTAEPHELKINILDVNSVSINKQDMLEFEIVTESRRFIGNFMSENDYYENATAFNLIFGNKFNYR
ncbi:MAG: hypothetical protein ACQEQG_10345 [Bacillota bacterium]